MRKNEMLGHVAHTGKSRSAYRAVVGKHEGKRLCERPRHRWESNIKMDFQKIGWGLGFIWLRIGIGGGLL
jgi:hypothetical protein